MHCNVHKHTYMRVRTHTSQLAFSITVKKTHYLLFGEGGTQHGGTLASHLALAFRLPFSAIDCLVESTENHHEHNHGCSYTQTLYGWLITNPVHYS